VIRVAPKKSLGQHFLVDRNLLSVIDRLAALDGADLEHDVGPGLGVLTKHLAARAALVHAVELDRTLEPVLRHELREVSTVRLHWGDALRLDLRSLEPPPTAFVANLPYAVATPLVVETLGGLPTVDRWCVMVQREVADRFFARPGTKAYSAVSVLVQLSARRTGFHPVSAHVFRPPPRVESALVAFQRVEAPGDLPAVGRVVNAAFAHRRKTLANGLALAGLATREQAVAALAALGQPASARAEELAPATFVELARLLDRAPSAPS
jgi:16S rRNA (adenine1518-N6/adenine1519-N6)-dimethyltransferase